MTIYNIGEAIFKKHKISVSHDDEGYFVIFDNKCVQKKLTDKEMVRWFLNLINEK